jgi:hypothetical protein
MLSNEEREEVAYNKGFEDGSTKTGERLGYIYNSHDKAIRLALVQLKTMVRKKRMQMNIPGKAQTNELRVLDSIIEELEKSLNP